MQFNSMINAWGGVGSITYSKSDTLEVYFRQGYSRWEPGLMDNEKRLQAFVERFRLLQSDETFSKISKIHIVSGCSPEGNWDFNQRLSKKRAASIKRVLEEYIYLPDSLIVVNSLGVNWEGLRRMIEEDDNVPYRDEVLEILTHPEIVVNPNGKKVETRKLRLAYLRDGLPWKYMYEHIFPTLRMSNLQIVVEWEKLHRDQSEVTKNLAVSNPIQENPVYLNAPESFLRPLEMSPERPSSFYMSLKTNTLYDLAAIPNVGVEFHLGRNWSLNANWMYAWWDHNVSHFFWRLYGGEIGFRKWFGKESKKKPLTGHHLGLYGQIFTYDFEVGGRGYLGGNPGGNLWDQPNYGGGIEYGYSLPIAGRLNIDFTIGVGYQTGIYHEYEPVDDCYVWQVTKRRHWFGPTKAEVSLVWLLGKGNMNKDKIRKR